MKVILLAGNGNDNKVWINNVYNILKPYIKDIIMIEYDHWENGNTIIDINKELHKVIKIVNQIEEDYIIFAKTAGVALTLKGIYQKKLNPKKCIFLGVPIIWSRFNNFKIDDWFNKYECETLFIQKSGDPDFYYDELKEYLVGKKLSKYKIVKIKGNDKKYNEIDEIKDIVLNYLNIKSN